jgi:trimeric autotransporter adhesin
MHRLWSFLLLLVWIGNPGAAAQPGPYRIQTVAGSANIGDGGPAASAQITNIQGVAVDAAGNLYLADTDNARIRKVSAGGTITTLAGTGAAGFSGDAGPATSAQLNLPYGVAVDTRGAVYVADLGNNRVRRIALDGTISTVAGNGSAASTGDGGPATAASLDSPRNLAVDAAGNLYISEFNGHRVRKVDIAGNISTIAGTGIAGFSGDNGPPAQAQLAYPAGLAFDSGGALYICDSQNNRVRRIMAGTIATVVGAGSTSLMTPVAVAVGGAATIYVADYNPMVHVLTSSSVWSVFAGLSTAGFSGDGGPAGIAQLTQPHDLAIDASGNIYIADGVRLRKVNSSGTIQTVAGDGYLNAVGDFGTATAAILYQPSGVSLDAQNNLYIADTGTQRIRQVTPLGSITTVAGNGTASQSADQISSVQATLNYPMGVTVNPSGNLLIADTQNERIREVSAGIIQTVVGTGVAALGAVNQLATQTPVNSPRNTCLGQAGALYVADTGNHRILSLSKNAITSVAAGNGASGFAGDGSQAWLAELNQPTACALDSSGNLYIADTGNNRIRKVNTAGIISTVAGTGAVGSAGDLGPATAALLNGPRGVGVDANGNLFIADTGNNRIREVTPDGIIYTIAGQNIAGFAGDGGPASAAQFNGPSGLLLDGSGNLYVADTYNNRVRQLTPGSTGSAGSDTGSVTVVNAASGSGGSVAPGEVVSIMGTNLGPNTGVSATFDKTGKLPPVLSQVAVQFDGVAAPLLYVQANQINVQVPYSVSGNTSTQIQLYYQGQAGPGAEIPVAKAAPGLFANPVNQDGTFNSQIAPATRGATITFYGTGEGLTNGSNLAGQAAASPYPQPSQAVTLKVGGVTATVVSASSAPGEAGILQVVATLPAASVLTAGSAKAVLTVGGVASAPLTVWLK